MTDPDDTLRLILVRLDQVSTRQELIVTGIHGLADILEVLGEQVSALVEWANEPPSTALADAMKGFEAALTALGDTVLQRPTRWLSGSSRASGRQSPHRVKNGQLLEARTGNATRG